MPSTYIVFSADQAAAALWTYGEDGLVDRARHMTRADLEKAWVIAGAYWREDHGLPLMSRLVLDKVTAFACMQHLEGAVRPLAQERRRPRKAMPAELRNAAPVPPSTTHRYRSGSPGTPTE
jgi:hypothetical protein